MRSIGELDWGARLGSSTDELDWELDWGARLGNSMGELDWGARLGSSIGEDVRTSPLRIFGIRIWCALQLRTTIVNAGRGFCSQCAEWHGRCDDPG